MQTTLQQTFLPPPQPTDKGMQQASSCVRSHFSLLQPGKAVIPMLLMLERLTYLTSHRYTTTTYASKKIFTPNNFISSPTHLPKACAVSTTPTYLPTYPSLTPKKKFIILFQILQNPIPSNQTKPFVTMHNMRHRHTSEKSGMSVYPPTYASKPRAPRYFM